jgi:hypothetical protein
MSFGRSHVEWPSFSIYGGKLVVVFRLWPFVSDMSKSSILTPTSYTLPPFDTVVCLLLFDYVHDLPWSVDMCTRLAISLLNS